MCVSTRRIAAVRVRTTGSLGTTASGAGASVALTCSVGAVAAAVSVADITDDYEKRELMRGKSNASC